MPNNDVIVVMDRSETSFDAISLPSGCNIDASMMDETVDIQWDNGVRKGRWCAAGEKKEDREPRKDCK